MLIHIAPRPIAVSTWYLKTVYKHNQLIYVEKYLSCNLPIKKVIAFLQNIQNYVTDMKGVSLLKQET